MRRSSNASAKDPLSMRSSLLPPPLARHTFAYPARVHSSVPTLEPLQHGPAAATLHRPRILRTSPGNEHASQRKLLPCTSPPSPRRIFHGIPARRPQRSAGPQRTHPGKTGPTLICLSQSLSGRYVCEGYFHVRHTIIAFQSRTRTRTRSVRISRSGTVAEEGAFPVGGRNSISMNRPQPSAHRCLRGRGGAALLGCRTILYRSTGLPRRTVITPSMDESRRTARRPHHASIALLTLQRRAHEMRSTSQAGSGSGHWQPHPANHTRTRALCIRQTSSDRQQKPRRTRADGGAPHRGSRSVDVCTSRPSDGAGGRAIANRRRPQAPAHNASSTAPLLSGYCREPAVMRHSDNACIDDGTEAPLPPSESVTVAAHLGSLLPMSVGPVAMPHGLPRPNIHIHTPVSRAASLPSYSSPAAAARRQPRVDPVPSKLWACRDRSRPGTVDGSLPACSVARILCRSRRALGLGLGRDSHCWSQPSAE
ncbi:hypothetical protein C8Q80DRAFT_822291 [Daedaleopsis nitida]|nr:hypothetical protein C8Q80DRAFT_822291 [Daedaleopsis nitida]